MDKYVYKKCEFCGSDIKLKTNQQKNSKNYGKIIKDKRFCSLKCQINWQRSIKWGGWSSLQPYSKEFNKLLKEEIKKLDNNRCCKCLEQNKKFAIHHIDYDKKNSNKNNLVTLCISCHTETNYNREKWQNYFENYIKNNRESQNDTNKNLE